MRTVIEVPDSLLRRARSEAAQRGIPLHAFIEEALREKLRTGPDNKPWLESFGKLRGLHQETIKINQIIDLEFGRLDPEDSC